MGVARVCTGCTCTPEKKIGPNLQGNVVSAPVTTDIFQQAAIYWQSNSASIQKALDRRYPGLVWYVNSGLHPQGRRQGTMAICCVGVSGLQSSAMSKELVVVLCLTCLQWSLKYCDWQPSMGWMVCSVACLLWKIVYGLVLCRMFYFRLFRFILSYVCVFSSLLVY